MLAATLALGLGAPGAQAGPRAGDFDYYILALSWSPSWCAAQGADGAGAEQCDPGRRTGFVVHGLWPQYEAGWPQDCLTAARDPSRRETAAMADVMGSGGLAWHQWKKHGRCSGLSPEDYFAAVRRAAAQVRRPPVYGQIIRDVTIAPGVMEDAFLAANPGMTRDGVTVTCDGPALDEVRICLTRDLAPRPCAPDSRRDCRIPRMTVPAPR